MTEPSDVNRRIAETIDALRPEGDYVRAVLGGKVIAHLAETQPDLLDAWLHDNAAVFMTDYIGVRERSQRATLRRGSEAAAFGAAAKAAEAGDVAALSIFEARLIVDDNDTARRIGDMTSVDHLYVASAYDASAQADLMLAAFHKAVAKKLGRRRTADVLSEQQYERLYRSIVRTPERAA